MNKLSPSPIPTIPAQSRTYLISYPSFIGWCWLFLSEIEQITQFISSVLTQINVFFMLMCFMENSYYNNHTL